MTTFNFLDELKSRGLLAQSSHEEELYALISSSPSQSYLTDEKGTPICVYAGFDPTAKSLHLGNLAILMGLKRAQEFGFTPIVLFGGATGLIGDPTGRTELRQMNTKEQIDGYIENFTLLTRRYFKHDVPNKPIFVNNYDWVGQMKWLDFARDIGVHFTIARLLAADANKSRFEAGGLTFLELGYQLLQAYDFMHLHENYNCVLQLGGNDQWSNILAGADLIRRLKSKKAFAVTLPLLVGNDGRKYGKSAGNATWLDAEMTSPYDFFQFLRNVHDNDVSLLLKVFSSMSVLEIENLINNQNINHCKEQMALQLTTLVHGSNEAEKALQASKALFTGNGDLSSAPKLQISNIELNEGYGILTAMVQGKLCASNSEARKVVQGNGLTLNGTKITDAAYKLKIQDFQTQNSGAVLKKGKKDFLLVQVN